MQWIVGLMEGRANKAPEGGNPSDPPLKRGAIAAPFLRDDVIAEFKRYQPVEECGHDLLVVRKPSPGATQPRCYGRRGAGRYYGLLASGHNRPVTC